MCGESLNALGAPFSAYTHEFGTANELRHAEETTGNHADIGNLRKEWAISANSNKHKIYMSKTIFNKQLFDEHVGIKRMRTLANHLIDRVLAGQQEAIIKGLNINFESANLIMEHKDMNK